MRACRLACLLLVAGGLGACTAPLPPLQEPVTATPGSPAAPLAMGHLTITIRWPRQVQLLPYSTNRIGVQVKTPAGDLLAETTLEQPTGTATSVTQLPVPAGEGLRVFVQGYQDDLKVAEGDATTTLRVNERTALAIHLAPVFVPTLDAFPPNGGVGAAIALTGTHFGATRNVPIQVTFGGLQASAVYRQDDTHLLAIVPPGFATGSLVVTADGVPSQPAGTFHVLQLLSPLAQQTYTLAPGATLSLEVTASTLEGPVADPYLEWSLVPVPTDLPAMMASASFDAATGSANVLTAVATGSAWIRVRSGTLLSTASLTVQ